MQFFARIGFLCGVKTLLKRIVSIILVCCCVVSFASCGISAKDVIKNNPENALIGYVSYSDSELAARSYAKDGAQLIGYNTLSDLLLAIENGYVNYGVLSEYECVLAESVGREVEIYSECPYKIDLCAYFRNDSSELRDKFNKSVANLKNSGKISKIKDAEYNGVTFQTAYTDEGDNELKILCNPSVDLFLYLTDDGGFAGIDAKILETFAEENGYYLSYVSVFEDDELFSKLESGEGDVVMCACSLVEERLEDYLASDVYFTIKFNLVTRKTV